jgi:hypothetical protein
VVLLGFSLEWGMAQHAPPRLYIAREILRGDAPYLNIIDLNSPGTLLLHALSLVVFGIGDAAWRGFDIAYLAATCAAAYALAASAGRAGGALAAILIALLHLSGGPGAPGDPEFLVVLPLLASAAALAYALPTGRVALIFLAGLAAGIAIAVKLSAIYFPLMMLLVVAWCAGRRIVLLAAFAIGAMAVPVAIAVWLRSTHAIWPYITMVRELQPFFDGVARLSLAWEAVRLVKGITPFLILFAPAFVWMAAALILARARLPWLSVVLCLVGIASGTIMIAIFPKDFEDFLYTFLSFGIVLGAIGFGALTGAENWGRRIAALGLIAYIAFTLPQQIDRYRHEASLWPTNPLRPLIMADLERLAPGDARVQVLEDFLAANDAVLHLGRRHTTSFNYDYFLFMFPQSALTQKMRARFLEELGRAPPQAIVVAHFPWWDYDSGTPGFKRLDSWPELQAVLARDYKLEVERINQPYQGGSGYRIYVRNTP